MKHEQSCKALFFFATNLTMSDAATTSDAIVTFFFIPSLFIAFLDSIENYPPEKICKLWR